MKKWRIAIGRLLCLEKATMDARWSMPLMDEVILSETEMTKPATPSSIPPRTDPSVTICMSAGGMEAWA